MVLGALGQFLGAGVGLWQDKHASCTRRNKAIIRDGRWGLLGVYQETPCDHRIDELPDMCDLPAVGAASRFRYLLAQGRRGPVNKERTQTAIRSAARSGRKHTPAALLCSQGLGSAELEEFRSLPLESFPSGRGPQAGLRQKWLCAWVTSGRSIRPRTDRINRFGHPIMYAVRQHTESRTVSCLRFSN